MEIRVKINIVDDGGKPFMGPGVLRLLEKIETHKSINRAAKEMRLSYVKALNMLNGLEAHLGEQVLVRKRGGNDRGGTRLTASGERYMAEYGRLEAQIRRLCDEQFQNFQTRIERFEPGPKDCQDGDPPC